MHPIETTKGILLLSARDPLTMINMGMSLQASYHAVTMGNGIERGRVFGNIIGGIAVGELGGVVFSGVGKGLAARGGGRVFWSGGDIAKNAAMDFAKSNGLTTLEMTTKGRIMNSISPYLPRSISGPIWDRLSRNFAMGASGDINVFQNAAGVSLKSTWRRIEYPTLRNNNIFYHIIDSRK